jgi:crossover junction endodeoxyribonuclease RuvC
LRILGIDPGTAITGYGVLEQQGNKLIPLSYGVIRTGPELGLAQRLNIIYDEVSKKIKLYQPDTMAVEQLFFNKNVRTALVVGHARGVILLCGSQANLPVVEYTPLQVKSAVVGYGTAEKKQVQEMVRILLGLEKIPKPDDAADALAIAICHAHSRLGREYERRCRG